MATAQQLRDAIDHLSALSADDLAVIWRQVSTADVARDALMDVLPALIDAYGTASATVAAEWYDQRREAAGVGRRFQANPAGLRGGGGGQELARWGVGPLFSESPDFARAQQLVTGGLQLRIANAARDTVTGAAIADPSARGWQRQAFRGCPFCQMLAGRGSVYGESSADFAAHDHCHCVAVPAFEGQPKPVQPYKPTDKNITDADRARVREYLASQ